MHLLRPLFLAALVGVLCAPTGAAAFPGETAQALVNRLGTPASGYDEPPKVDPDLLRRGSHPRARVHWMNIPYDPLQTGQTFQGVLVVLFGFDRDSILNREKTDGKIEFASWTDLRSEREVFLGQISSEQFARLQAGMNSRWLIRSVAHYENTQRAYDLYSLQSRDGRLKAEMSYSDLKNVKEFPLPPDAPPDAPKPPKLNFWIQVDSIKP